MSELNIDVQIYLCKGCGGHFEPGARVVSLTDGYVSGENDYHVENRRLYHRDCWPPDSITTMPNDPQGVP